MKYLLTLITACGLAFAIGRAEGAKPQAAEDSQDLVLLTEGHPLFVRAHVRVDGKPFRAMWEQFVDRVFKFVDRNGDGTLDKREIDAMPPTSLLVGGGPSIYTAAGPAPRLAPNSDGKATRDDFAAFLRRAGASAFQFQAGTAGLSPYGVRVINLGENQPVSAEALNDAIYELLDVSHDGKLSAEELAAAPARFLARDTDDDEMVTNRELIGPKRAPATESPVVIRRSPAASGYEAAASTSGPVVLLNSGESGAALAKRLLAHYGKGRKKLTNDDLGMDKGVFEKLDADKDGSLDAEELAQFAKRAPDLEMTFRVGSKGDKETSVEGTSRTGGAKLKALDGGAVRLESGVSRFDLYAGEKSSNAGFTMPNFRLRDQYINIFKMADGDNNNYLDTKEAEANGLFRGLFKALDTDGDGMLYEKEMVAYLDKLEDVQKAVRDGCVTLTFTDRGGGLFDLLDKDKDGRLSVREMRGVPELLKLNKSGNGLLARSEVPRDFEARVRRGPAAGGDGAGVFVVAARLNSFDSGPADKGAGPTWFRKMDTNRDGDLSRREFLGTDADFKRLDADSDGLISAKEGESAEKIWASKK